MRHRELTHQIIGACLEVANELGHGFVESVYRRAVLIALRAKGLRAEPEVALRVHFRGTLSASSPPTSSWRGRCWSS